MISTLDWMDRLKWSSYCPLARYRRTCCGHWAHCLRYSISVVAPRIYFLSMHIRSCASGVRLKLFSLSTNDKCLLHSNNSRMLLHSSLKLHFYIFAFVDILPQYLEELIESQFRDLWCRKRTILPNCLHCCSRFWEASYLGAMGW